MTPTEAAKIIGCTPGQVRTLIRAGRLQGRRKKTPFGFYYELSFIEVRQYAKRPQPCGFPRGRKRRRNRKLKGSS